MTVLAQLHGVAAVAATFGFFHVFSFAAGRRPLGDLLDSVRRLTGEAAKHPPTDGGANTISAVQRGLRLARVLDYQSRPDCLPRSLAAFVVLRRAGIPAELRIGARKHPFAAHAWVEVAGTSVTDRASEHALYQPMLTVS